ncbi:MAG: hypothetical protein ACYTER_02170 [Planctomycetota bacterium]|jgi:hypothetical protein
MFKNLPALMILVLLLVVCINSTFAVNRYGDISIQVTSPGTGYSTFGYVDYQVAISNTGAVSHEVKLIIPRSTSSYGNCIRQISRTVTVPANSAATVSLFQPPLRMNGGGANVVIDGKYQPQWIGLNGSQHCQGYHYGSGHSCCVLVSQQVGFDDVNKSAGQIFEVSQLHSGNNGLSLNLSEVPTSSWSRNWLSYSRYNGIMLTGNEWQTAGPEVQRGILEYVSCGGNLTIVGPAELDSSVTALETDFGIFKTVFPGFGVIHQTNQAKIASWKNSDWQVLKDTWLGLSRTLQNTKSVKAANDWFPVIDNLNVPVRGLLLIVLLFAILIGPANLFILGRKKRQIWLLWTVPLLSIVGSIIVFGYATFAEGWKGYSRTMSVTILDEHRTLASTIGVTAFYCPLTPQDGLHFDYETECSPQVEQGYRSGGRGRSIDWSDDQHLASGWVSARVPTHFKVRKSQMRREKVVFSKQPDQLEALNGLGVAIEALYYADADGNCYTAENIQPGAKIQLAAAEQTRGIGSHNPEMTRDFFEGDWMNAAKAMTKEPYQYLRPS